MQTKQVIVIRRDLKMRRGKEIAQSCHASLAFLTRQIHGKNGNEFLVRLSEVAKAWVDSSYTKVCVRVNSEAELLEIYEKAKSDGLEVHLITDNGKTEFGGVPTRTCLAIGPDESDKIDAVTGHLELY